MESHAITRARERYGLELTPEDIRSILDRIHRGYAGYLGRRKAGAECYDVEARGKIIRVVTRRERGRMFVMTIVERENGIYQKEAGPRPVRPERYRDLMDRLDELSSLDLAAGAPVTDEDDAL